MNVYLTRRSGSDDRWIADVAGGGLVIAQVIVCVTAGVQTVRLRAYEDHYLLVEWRSRRGRPYSDDEIAEMVSRHYARAEDQRA